MKSNHLEFFSGITRSSNFQCGGIFVGTVSDSNLTRKGGTLIGGPFKTSITQKSAIGGLCGDTERLFSQPLYSATKISSHSQSALKLSSSAFATGAKQLKVRIAQVSAALLIIFMNFQNSRSKT